MDHYNTLGVPRDATQDEIKKAYKRLAAQHHPDRGGDQELMAKINSAYDVLGDPEARASYDNPQFTAFASGFASGPSDFRSIFEQMANQGFGRQPQRNPDQLLQAQLSAIDVFHGSHLNVDINGKSLNVAVPPGTRHGTKLRLHGEGPLNYPELPPGDILIKINVLTPENIMLQQNDIFQKVDINALQAMVGDEIEIDHLSGSKVKMKIPAGTQQGTKHRLSHQGMPDPRNPNLRGDMYVIPVITIPRIVDEGDVNVLNNIRDKLKE